MSMPVRVIEDPAEMSAWSATARAAGERLAFVPTMGALHAGHVSLLHEGRRHADGGAERGADGRPSATRVVLSIFVNPTQFGPREDFERYPRDLAGDLQKAEVGGADVAFVPPVEAIYPPGHQSYVQVRELEQGLCGALRPGHFIGVATVVCKLFNIVRPHLAVFGEKDFQQLAVVRRMVQDLFLPIDIVAAPIVREPDGLAMSSRNAYLSPADRARAAQLYAGLCAARLRFAGGERRSRALVETARQLIAAAVDSIDYVELRDAFTLAPLEIVDEAGAAGAVLLLAAHVGGTRLIDNVRL
jgi:pantoate--beta-alanine ligase